MCALGVNELANTSVMLSHLTYK